MKNNYTSSTYDLSTFQKQRHKMFDNKKPNSQDLNPYDLNKIHQVNIFKNKDEYQNKNDTKSS